MKKEDEASIIRGRSKTEHLVKPKFHTQEEADVFFDLLCHLFDICKEEEVSISELIDAIEEHKWELKFHKRMKDQTVPSGVA